MRGFIANWSVLRERWVWPEDGLRGESGPLVKKRFVDPTGRKNFARNFAGGDLPKRDVLLGE
jgi:hypothetical protein